MKVLLVTPVGMGHVLPMVPLAQALGARCHAVLWALPDAGVPLVEQSGIDAVGTSPLPPTRPSDVMQRFPELRELSPDERPTVMFSKLFGALIAPPMLAGLTPVAHDWQPDLVVSDAADFAGPIVAAKLGVPGVTKGFGALLREPQLARVEAEVAPLWRSRGLEPRSVRRVVRPPVHRPVPAGAAAAGRAPCAASSANAAGHLHRTRRHLGRASAAGRPPGPAAGLRDDGHGIQRGSRTAGRGAALGQLDVRLLVTVGPQGDPALLGEQPAHVRVERYVSQSALLPHCHVVVSHAGSGTAMSALELGLPQLCLPQGADQFVNAAAISSAGAAISLVPAEATASAVTDAVVRLLDDASYREAAERLSASIAAMPSPDDVCAVLEKML